MAIDSSPGDVALGQLTSLPFGDLLGGPLNAAIAAQGNAAISTYEFIKAVGVRENSTTKTLEAVTVAFSYQSPSGETRNLIVPLLSIVPIPLVLIDDLTVSFKANISAEASVSDTSTDSAEFGTQGSASMAEYFANANFSARYSSKKDSSATQQSKFSVQYTMDVNMHASQAAMPAGLAKVLQLLGESAFTTDPNGAIVLQLDMLEGTMKKDRMIPKASEPGMAFNLRIVDGSGRGVAGVVPAIAVSNGNLSVPTVYPNTQVPMPTPTNTDGYTYVWLANEYAGPDTSQTTVTLSAKLPGVKFQPDLTASFDVSFGP